MNNNQKSVADINNWFISEVRNALNDIPEGMKKVAKTNKEAALMIAESIGRKKCFNVKEVLIQLDSLL